MRAVIARKGKLIVGEMATPEPGPGEVLVRTLACGICGSDLHAGQHTEIVAAAARKSGGFFRADPQHDLVLGHEFCAEVVDYGPYAGRRLKPGTRVCSAPVIMIGTGLEPVGFSNAAPGGYGQYMRLLEGLLLPVPNGLSTEHAALTEPVAVGVHAVNRAGIERNHVAVVVGCGPVGLAVIAALKLRGVGPIIAVDYSAARRDLAVRMGAHEAVDPVSRSPYASFREVAVAGAEDAGTRPSWMTGPLLRPQVIFECVGVRGVLQQVLEGAEPGARVVVVGVCMEPDTIEPIYAINKEMDLRFAFGYSPEEFAATLGHIAEGAIPVEPLVTGIVGLEGVAGAFEELAHPDRHAKILIDPWRTDDPETIRPPRSRSE